MERILMVCIAINTMIVVYCSDLCVAVEGATIESKAEKKWTRISRFGVCDRQGMPRECRVK